MTHWMKMAGSEISVGFRHPWTREWQNTRGHIVQRPQLVTVTLDIVIVLSKHSSKHLQCLRHCAGCLDKDIAPSSPKPPSSRVTDSLFPLISVFCFKDKIADGEPANGLQLAVFGVGPHTAPYFAFLYTWLAPFVLHYLPGSCRHLSFVPVISLLSFTLPTVKTSPVYF